MRPGELDGVLERLETTLRGAGYQEQASSVARSRAALSDFVGSLSQIPGFGQVIEVSVSVDVVLSPVSRG